MPCDCIELVNEKLHEQDMELELSFVMPECTAVIPINTQWVSGIKKRKKKPTTILASFCPFCGKKVEVGKTK